MNLLRRMPRGRSTRNRILGWYLVLLAIALAGALLLQRSYLVGTVNAAIEEDLRQEYAALRHHIDENVTAEHIQEFGGEAEAIFETYLQFNHITSPGETVATFLGESTPFLGDQNATALAGSMADLREALDGIDDTRAGEIGTSEGLARYLAVPLRAVDADTGEEFTAGVFLVAQFVDARMTPVDQAFRTGALIVLLLFVLVSAIGWLVAGRVLQPLRDLTSTAESISENDLSRRIPVDGEDELARLATTFNDMLDRLEEAFTTQRRFIDDAGHELRTPITIIRGHLELLGDDQREREQTVEVVTEELDRMARIVDDLLVLARAEQPDFVVSAPVDVEDFTVDLMSRAWTLAPNRHWSIDETAPLVVQADAQRLTQAMVNLIRNVGVHTPPGTPAAIGSALGDGAVHLWVRDAGPGIPQEDLANVFERFRRGSHARRSAGAGLGLSIVAAIAEAHGGDVEVASDATGTRFELVLPYVGEDVTELIFH